MKSKEWIHHREPSQQGLQVWRALIPIDDGERARRKHHSDFERAAWCWNRSIIDRSNIIHIRVLLGKVPTNVWMHQFCEGSRIYSILRQRVFKKTEIFSDSVAQTGGCFSQAFFRGCFVFDLSWRLGEKRGDWVRVNACHLRVIGSH